MAKNTTFSDSDEQAGRYLWSDPDNWSAGVPASGDSVIETVAGTDDIGSLSLMTLALSGDGELDVTGASLTVATVEPDTVAILTADARDAGAPVTVTVNDITGTGGVFVADGSGAVFLDNSATVTANLYEASEYGLFEMASTPSAGANLDFESTSTIALEKPAAVNAVTLTNVSAGDTLELPGDAVSNVTIGSSSLEITTNLGSYDFTHVTYGESFGAYVAAPDSSTGLEAITFGNPDVFSDNESPSSGPNEYEYLWSDAANWSAGVPTNGNLVDMGSSLGVDDISSLKLGGLTMADDGEVLVTGSLTVTTFQGGLLGANGGFVELMSSPGPGSELSYDGGGKIAFPHAAAVDATPLALDGLDDVLELPGSVVESVTFGTNSLDVTTNAGSFAFTNVTYATPISSDTSSFDSGTKLVAITLRGFDEFSEKDAQPILDQSGYLWSDDANWSTGIPPDTNDGVAMDGTSGIDDISSLTLSTLALGDGGQVQVLNDELTVATVTGASGGLSAVTDISSESYPTAQVLVGDITGSGGGYQADAFAGGVATFVDNSPTDTGNDYNVSGDGGFFELNAAPSGSSTFGYSNGGTIALEHPQAVIDAAFTLNGPGDILELPGSSVLNFTIGSDSLDVVTNAGAYDFTNVTFEAPIAGYSAYFDSSTNLEAVVAVGFDTFGDNEQEDLGYQWSDSNNWSNFEPPNDGGGVDMDGLSGIDDIDSLSLTTLSLEGGGGVTVVATELAVNTVSGDGDLSADSEIENGPVTVTIGRTLGGNEYGATGSLAKLIDNSSVDAGNYFDVVDGGTIEFAASLASSSVISFDNGGRVLFEDPGSTIAASLTGLGKGDVLELPGDSVRDVTFGSNSLEITTDAGSFAFTDVSYSAFTAGYSSAYDAEAGLVAVTIACYLRGTKILGESAEIPIEELAIGDRVRTRDGSYRPIKWIGRRRHSAIVAKTNREVQPVLIRAGALGEGLPKRDLRVSPDHGMYVDEMLISARDLVNGESIVREEPADELTYYHLEFDTHAVIFAEGAPAESFVDDESREMFDNAAEFDGLYPNEVRRPASYCAPRVEEGWELEKVRLRLAGRPRVADRQARVRSGTF